MTSTVRRVTAGLSAALLFGLFLGLGTWQIERRAWKLDLIARVEQRVHAAPVDAPLRAEWPSVTAASHEYRRVQATGVFLPAAQTRVQALTELGSGFWLMTPLRLGDGGIVLVNRGFVSGESGAGAAAARAPVATTPVAATVTGLLRMTEPGGGFLRRNDPAKDRWYSRDVQAIAAARGLGPVAPYFIDAEGPERSTGPAAAGGAATAAAAQLPGTADTPVGGLTVVAFHNNHLIYAITWYTLAFMIPAALWLAQRPTAAANAS